MSENKAVKQDRWYYNTSNSSSRKKVKRQRNKAHRKYGKEMSLYWRD